MEPVQCGGCISKSSFLCTDTNSYIMSADIVYVANYYNLIDLGGGQSKTTDPTQPLVVKTCYILLKTGSGGVRLTLAANRAFLCSADSSPLAVEEEDEEVSSRLERGGG